MAEKSTWPVEFDWRKTALKLSKMAIKFAVSGVPPSPGDVIDAVVDNIKLAPEAAGKDGAPPTPEALITLWLNQAMALAMIDVFREAQEHASKPLPLEIEESVVQPGGLDPTALYEPQDVDVWAMVGEATLKRLDDCGVSKPTALEIAGDLADRFVERFWGLVAGHEARGGTIPILLKRDVLSQRAAEAAAWRENRRRLIRTPREADKNPLLDGKASLEQIYVPLQAYEAVEDSRLKGLRRRGDEDHGDRRPLMRLLSLDQELYRWVDDPRAPSVRIVAGGPGFGKSSAALMLAARRAIEPGWRVLLVPLHQVAEAMTWDSVEDAIRATSTVMPQALAQAARGRKILLIFDGLDELATKNESGVLPLDTLVAQIRDVVEIRNRDGRGMRALLLGRDLAAGEASRAAGAADDMLHVLPLRPTDEDRERYRWQNENAPEFDHRQEWWRRYREAVPGAPDLPVTLFENESFTEITSLPVLMSLLAFSLGEKPAPDNLATLGRVELYDGICKAAYRRAWGESDQQPHWGVESEDDFFRLVEDIALATGRHNTRRATVEDLTAVLKASAGPAGEEQVALIAESDGAAAKRVLMLFFFRDGVEGEVRSVSSNRMVFEFTHKSFADYLLARRLLRAAREGVNPGAWARLFGAFRIEMAVVDFLRPEALRQRGDIMGCTAQPLEDTRDQLTGLLSVAVGEGFPISAFQAPELSSSALARQVAHAELALVATLDAVCRALDRIDEDGEQERCRAMVKWPDPWAAWRMIGRQPPPSDDYAIGVGLEPASDPARECLARLAFVMDREQSRMEVGMILEAAAKTGQKLLLDNVNLAGSNLEYANLWGTSLENANLEYANLRSANLEGANLEDANLEGANLEDANLERGNLADANLDETNFAGANLRGADLWNATLWGANLDRSNLSEASLGSAILRDASLKAANLRGASLLDAKLWRTNFQDADLSDAKLNSADLEGSDLEGADLEGTDLRYANLVGATGITSALNVDQAIMTTDLRAALGLAPQPQDVPPTDPEAEVDDTPA